MRESLKSDQADKFRGAIEMAGAMAHELNQILQQFLGYSNLISLEAEKLRALTTVEPDQEDRNAAEREMVENLRNLSSKLLNASSNIGDFAGRISSLQCYRTIEYLPGRQIIDLDTASRNLFSEVTGQVAQDTYRDISDEFPRIDPQIYTFVTDQTKL